MPLAVRRSLHALLLALGLLAAAGPAAAQKGLRTYRTREAIVKSNAKSAISRAVGERLDNYCRTFREFYDELGLDSRSDNKIVARVFNTFEEYDAQYRRQNPDRDSPMAYFSPSLNSLVLYNDEQDVTLRQTLFHEASHQFLNRYAYEAPKWINEGLAEYFEGWRTRPDGTLIEKRVNLYDLKLLQSALESGAYLPPRVLIEMPAETFRDFGKHYPDLHPYLHYVTAWGIVWHCLEGENETDRERMVRYLEELTSKGDRAVFEVDDWEAFEARWRRTVLRLKPEPKDPVDYVLLAAGYRGDHDWAEAVRLYEKALELDPEFPGVHYWLGYCYKRGGAYDLARKWLEKARVSEPENPSPLYLLARIEAGLDKEGAPVHAERAVELALEASKMTDGELPGYQELLARCYAVAGEYRSAIQVARKIAKLVDDDEELEAYYEKLVDELTEARKRAKD